MGWGYAIGAGLNLLGSAFDYDRQKALDRDERAFQSAEAEKAYQRQLDFWNIQNEYNLPSAQRKRLEDAGYNILDLMRNGSAVTQAGSLSPVASAGAGRGSSAPLSTLADGATSLMNAVSQRRLADSQSVLNDMRARGEELENVRRTIENLEKQDSREARVRLDYYYRYERELLRGMESSNENVEQNTLKQRAETVATEALGRLRNVQIDTEKTKQALNNASTAELVEKAKQYASLIGANESQANYYIELARLTASNADKAEYVYQQLKENGLDVTQGGVFGSAERLTNISFNKAREFYTWLLSLFAKE